MKLFDPALNLGVLRKNCYLAKLQKEKINIQFCLFKDLSFKFSMWFDNLLTWCMSWLLSQIRFLSGLGTWKLNNLIHFDATATATKLKKIWSRQHGKAAVPSWQFGLVFVRVAFWELRETCLCARCACVKQRIPKNVDSRAVGKYKNPEGGE